MSSVLEDATVYCIGEPGLVCMSVCAPKEMEPEQVEAWANRKNPTGISSPWAVSDDEFSSRSGHPNPCPCDQEPEARLHYLLNC